MPDVTADMLNWWFVWHGLDPLRYAIWDPEDHFDVTINEEGRKRALDPTIPMAEKTWGATHTVQESIGGPPDEIVMQTGWMWEIFIFSRAAARGMQWHWHWHCSGCV